MSISSCIEPKDTQASPKSPSETAVEMVEMALPNDANSLGNVLGGKVMHWIDIAAAIAAHRHCGRVAVTAAVERLSFLHPIKVGELAKLSARLVYAGKTSMVVKVDVRSEDMDTGEEKTTSLAYLTFVALGQDGKPCPVPELKISTPEELSEFKKAEEMRRTWRHVQQKRHTRDNDPNSDIPVSQT